MGTIDLATQIRNQTKKTFVGYYTGIKRMEQGTGGTTR